MTADRRALTIVIAFLGLVMLAFWIAHAFAIATQNWSDVQGADAPTRIESVQR